MSKNKNNLYVSKGKNGDSMRIPGVLDFTGAKYPFKKESSNKRLIKKHNFGDNIEYENDNTIWQRVKSNSGKYLYVPTKQDSNGERRAIEYDQQGRFSGYEKPDYNSRKHTLRHFSEEDKKNPWYSQTLYESKEDIPEIAVGGSKEKVGKIRKRFIDEFGEEIGNEQYNLIESIARSNNLENNLEQIANKYFEIYSLAGKPKIGHEATFFQFVPAISSFFKHGDFSDGWNRAMINPVSGYIHYTKGNPGTAITEYAHGFNQNNNEFIDNNPEFKEDLLQYVYYPSDISKNIGKITYESGYQNPTHNEFRAHKVIEPMLWRYLVSPSKNDFIEFLSELIHKDLPFTYKDPSSNKIRQINNNHILKRYRDSLEEYNLALKEDMDRRINYINPPFFKKGSKIYIKKQNRGKFTDYCGGNVTQNCINRAKKSGNKTLVKRAVFAENARKWKH